MNTCYCDCCIHGTSPTQDEVSAAADKATLAVLGVLDTVDDFRRWWKDLSVAGKNDMVKSLSNAIQEELES